MRAEIYKQSYDGKVMDLILEDNVVDPFAVIHCFDCGGSGIFEIDAHHHQDCVACKGSGKDYVSMY